MARCAVDGGCPSDYIAIAFASLCMTLLIFRSILPYVIYKIPLPKGSRFWIPVIQVFASLNLLLSIVISVSFFKFKRQRWRSCYIWAVWVEGPLGFGLLLSSRIAQTFQLYYIFVRRRLPPIKTYIFLPLILLPWISGATFINVKKPLNYRCHMGPRWIIPIMSLHILYVATLIVLTWAVRHIEFRFDELRDLWKGVIVSASSIGVWVSAYITNEIHEEILGLQVASRFLLLVTASILVLTFFSISSSQPLVSQISLRKREALEYDSMGHALGIPDSGLLLQREPETVIDPNEPLEKLLLNKRFRRSFMAFADREEVMIDAEIIGGSLCRAFGSRSLHFHLLVFLCALGYSTYAAIVRCLAGENVHFYDEVHELGKLPLDDPVRRIYMARHIIDSYITPGATLEVNISHRCRQEILTTSDLADPNLFNNALIELIQLIKMNLAKDFWSSMFFLKLKEETSMRSNGRDLEQMASWNLSPRLSSVQGADDPFHQEQFSKGSGHDCTHDSDH